MLAFAGAAAQAPAFRTRAEGVRLEVLVTDRSRPLAGLTKDDFIVRDNGVTQTLDSVSVTEGAHVILALDTSSSVTGARLEALVAAARTVTKLVTDRDKVTMLAFSSEVRLLDPNGLDAKALARPGLTSFYDALLSAIVQAATDARPAVVLMLTDGLDTSSWLDGDEGLEIVRRRELVVYPVLAGAAGMRASREAAVQARLATVDRLADVSGGRVLDVETHERFPAAVETILAEYRQRYVVTYTPSDSAPGLHRLDVRLRNRNAAITVRREYWRRPS